MNPKKLARLIHPAFRFGTNTVEEALKLVQLGVGGFCFYEGAAEEVRETARLLKRAAAGPLLISADYENSAGHWLKTATELPSNMAIGSSGSETLARRKGEIIAAEASALGVDWVLAPVVDLAVNPDNPIVNLRSFGASTALVSRLASAYISGLKSGGSLCCIKHFPGHGETSVDSHLVLPVLERSREELEGSELEPYRALLTQADAVMAGHLMAPALDKENPASLSRNIITGLLRQKMGYAGCVVTDALNMKAVSENGTAGVKALQAGADILLYPEEPRVLLEALQRAAEAGAVTEEMADLAILRQVALLARRRNAPPAGELSVVGCAGHRAFAAEAAPSCLAWAFRSGPFTLKADETVYYFEPGTAREGWKGTAFVDELNRLGIRVEAFAPHLVRGGQSARRHDKIIIGSFSKPTAFSGSINLNAAASEEIETALAGAKESLMAAFGSPFVFGRFQGRLSAGLCAFCGLEDFQKAAAAAAAGRGEANGNVPVDLKLR